MPAYIVALIDIKDPVKYKGYGDGWDFKSFTEDYGGELLMINARAWYDSPEYHDVRKIRWASSTTSMTLHPGFDVDAALAARASGE